ncbi:hypothetical protein [Tunturiibacter gelidiferens]|uniref:hypothetical protein n=1 Tax=Tunturiibacter gelidiferens TaxID=3069689 RepID=UPI003D9AE295
MHDADVRIDLSRGLPDLRIDWIKQRNDTEILSGPTSEYARWRERDLLTSHLRSPSPFVSRRARSGRNVSQMHYARKGIITPEMEFVALRESMHSYELLEDPAYRSLLSQHRGQPFGAQFPPDHARICPRRSGRRAAQIVPANINHFELEPIIIGRNFRVKSRQHRQLRSHLFARRRSGQNDLGHTGVQINGLYRHGFLFTPTIVEEVLGLLSGRSSGRWRCLDVNCSAAVIGSLNN